MILQRRSLVLAVLPLLSLPGCNEKPAAKAAPPQKVVVVQPVERDVQRYEEFTGRINPVELVEVRARANGYLEEVHFEEGAEVKKNDLLYTIDPREYKALRDAAAAAHDQASSRLLQARSDLERGQQLVKTAAIPKQELERLASEVRHMEAAVRLAKADLDKAELNLSYTKMEAPISGKISRTSITEGNLIQEGDTLTTIVRQDPLYVYFEAPEKTLQSWSKDEALDVQIGLSQEKGYPHKAKLDFTDNRLNANTGTLQLRATLPNPDRIFRPGYFARVRVAFGAPQKTWMIPERAVGSDQGDRFLYIVGKDNKLEYRRIETGQVYHGYRAVEQGLAAGEQVVSEGITMLKPGMEVAIVQAATPEPAKANAGAEIPARPHS